MGGGAWTFVGRPGYCLVAGGAGCGASVLAGASRPEQIAANAQAASWGLRADDVAEIRAMLGDGGV